MFHPATITSRLCICLCRNSATLPYGHCFLAKNWVVEGGTRGYKKWAGEAQSHYGGHSSYPNKSGKPIDPACHQDQKQGQAKNQITRVIECIDGDPLQGHSDRGQNDRSTQQKEGSLLSYRRPTAGKQ